jgi:predicted amidophosphoribosyltransferase
MPKGVNVRSRNTQISSTETFKGGNRKKPAELRANYRFNERQFANLPESIGVVDDLLTTGSHYRAVKDMILERAPATRIVGFFIARRAIPSPFSDVSEADLLS